MTDPPVAHPGNAGPENAARSAPQPAGGFGASHPFGEVVGDFRLLSKLGGGAMGVVYKAHQISLDQDVALKILSAHLAANDEFVERFIREARMSVKLKHPGIVHGVAVGTEQGVHYFAMEFVDGENLDQWLAKLGRFSVGDAVKITVDVARALEHAHSRHILHRDIKPSNVMIACDGEVKLADLGLAKVTEDDSGLTQVGEMAGTPAYMPPEQARDAKNADGRSDIYALGATLYTLLTGKKAFTGPTPIAVVEAKEKERYEPVHRLNPEVPEQLESIIKRMLAANPERRFQSAAEVIEALEATGLANPQLLLDGSATATVIGTPGPPPVRSRTLRLWVLSAILAAAIIGATYLANRFQIFGVKPPETAHGPADAGQPSRAQVAPAEPTDRILARAIDALTAGQIDAARTSLARGLEAHPGAQEIERPSRELGQGVLLLFQYQTPEALSPVVPIWSADGVKLSREDNYRFAIIPGRTCYVYAFQRDTRPSVARIFPNSGYSAQSNPLGAGKLYWLPDDPRIAGASWMHLDTSIGEERIYFVAANKPLRDPDGFGTRLESEADGLVHALAKDLDTFLEAGGPPGESCFANRREVVQVFQFNHR